MLLLIEMYGTLKRVVCYFEEEGMALWREMYGTLKSVVCYFEEECIVKRVISYF